MKKRLKIKNYILTFIISLFGAFAFNSVKTNATAFPNNNNGDSTIITYDEGTGYSYTLNDNTYTYFINYDTTEASYIVNYYYYNDMQSRWEYRSYYYCNLTVSNSYLQLSCSRYQFMYSTGYTNPSSVSATSNFYIFPDYFRNEWNGWQFKPASTGGYTEEDIENAFNEGVKVGNNAIALIDNCTIVSLNDTPYGYSCSDVSTNPYDEYNNIVDMYNLANDLSEYYNVIIDYNISRWVNPGVYFMIYTNSNMGARIELYNEDTLIRTITTDSTNYNDTYVFTTLDSSINLTKIRLYYDDYNTHVKQFGFYSTSQINPIKNHYEFIGYKQGYVQGNESGNNLMGMVATVMQQPVNMLITIFDFEFLGINLASFLFSLVTLLVVIWLVKKFI